MNDMPESIFVSFVENKDPDKNLLVVGKRQVNRHYSAVDILNSFSGTEATELWNKLTTKENNNG